jgi:hypothetical protein
MLEAAPRSRCPYCERRSKTVGGAICADCWAYKDRAAATVVWPKPSVEPLPFEGGVRFTLEALRVLVAARAVVALIAVAAVLVAELAKWT